MSSYFALALQSPEPTFLFQLDAYVRMLTTVDGRWCTQGSGIGRKYFTVGKKKKDLKQKD